MLLVSRPQRLHFPLDGRLIHGFPRLALELFDAEVKAFPILQLDDVLLDVRRKRSERQVVAIVVLVGVAVVG